MGALAGVEKFTGLSRWWETDFTLRVRPKAMGINIRAQSVKPASIQNRNYVRSTASKGIQYIPPDVRTFCRMHAVVPERPEPLQSLRHERQSRKTF
jgi:hypothetical protein